MVRLENILEKVASYSPKADLELIKKAYVVSGVLHQGQIRQSGEPYLTHPLEVANILADMRMDSQSVATGLLHDTVEDTHTTIERIDELFGPEIAGLVDGLTKLSRMTFEKKADHEAENFRKMVLAMGRDIRVILIKLADRLHNMRTLGSLDPAKQRKIAQETLDIYAPLANRLGIGWIKTELEDLAFMYLEPESYADLKEKLASALNIKENFIETVKEQIEAKLKENGVEGDVSGRPKHLFSIYKKMKEQDVEFDRIYDIMAFRVIVNTLKDCYGVLGIIHSTWKPVPGRFKDYIAIPKLNMYQSLHTTVVGPFGVRMEVQIRTEEMHRIAEYGIAAHWRYKEGREPEGKDDKSFAWLRQLLEFQMDLKDSDEFMDSLKVGLFPEEVFVFTPKGDIKQFPLGATPVDFAYSVHTDIGNTCSGAKVNGKMVPLKYRLRNGDIVEIITSQSHNPSKDWLKFVVSSRAKARIRQWIKTEERAKSIALGKEILDKELTRHSLEPGKFLKSEEFEKIAAGFGVQGAESLLASVGYGKISANQVLGKLLPPEKLRDRQKFSFRRMFDKWKPGEKDRSAIIVRGVEDVLVRFAKCCNPLPGDEIEGYITHGQGVAIHAVGCPTLLHIDRDRRIEVAWDRKIKSMRPVSIQVVCRNEKGLLAEMTNAIKTADANISSADIRTSQDNKAVCTFEVEVSDSNHLKNIISALKSIKKVTKVERIKSGTPREAEAESVP
ncbi:MAG: bifunctional (p)ppGpp synthetase/guanosine-3',5'-bis(diphosphate) 3'-pyrophosphohydrolase [Deltaproteobacteria bacterium]|nr:bifunctional (p)ppGpp synthetase/guanosine-3',5'-bis(diphosphate) 3'-pyrophosphohydrolase [Deltaproteobacteria bacterium]MBZ0218998.1 bifunctional (p)ppGpp synthetase/guanosine-3',5'-bis(diphosphate) 3'-pyrophosphohydrolase [Deltaproteobacteria bacterium]